ncbi:hypothetical protein ACQKFS_01120 [Pseudomonas guineae]|uniref:hypothetical protein n=1 Tax=Pseudomonas guineae TaxID=425504 RepID=UPI003D0230E7
MDALTFIGGIVNALAWPAAIVIISLIFRKPLSGVLTTIKRGKFGAAEIEFERGVRSIETSAPELPHVATPPLTMERATIHPRLAVLEAWLKLEDQVIDLALSRGLTQLTARRYARGAFQGLKESGLLKPNHLELLDELEELRNWAVHYPDFSPDPSAVVSYIQSAAALGRELELLTK